MIYTGLDFLEASVMWAPVVLGIMLDQLIKLLVVMNIPVGGVATLFPGLSIALVMNRGVALSLFSMTEGVYHLALNIVIFVFNLILVELLSVSRDSRPLYRFSLQLVISGGLSNMVDRICYGAVVDYIYLNFAGVQWPAIFNFADVMITLGCVMIVFESFYSQSAPQRSSASAV